LKTLADTDNDAAGSFMTTTIFNKWNCPAKFTNEWIADGDKTKLSSIVMSAKNWWCSDGSFNLTDDAAYGTKGATASMNGATINTQDGKKMFDSAKLILNQYDKDRRDELLFAQCRQKNKMCGASKIDEAGTDANNLRTISADNTNGFDADEKCTWVLRSKTKAPTFVISNLASNALEATVDVVYQEWVDGWQLEDGKTFISGYDGETAYPAVGGVPNHAMV